MQLSNESIPVLVLITSKQCGHCTTFRGTDGVPKTSNSNFNVPFVHSLIRRNRTNFFVELHVSSNSKNSELSEVNLYANISTSNLSNLINSREILTDDNISLGEGNEFARISIRKNGINVMISNRDNLVDSPTLTRYYMDKFIWNNIPENIKELRRVVSEGLDITDELISKLEDRFVKAQVYDKTQHMKFREDARSLDYILLNYGENIFNISEVVSSFVPLQIRDYEISYPCWLLVSGKWWNKGLRNRNLSIFARKAGGTTFEENGRFKVRQITVRPIDKFLKDYDDGKIGLDGPEVLRNYFS